MGPLGLAVLEAMGGLGAKAGHRHVKCHRIVDAVEGPALVPLCRLVTPDRNDLAHS